MQIRLNINGFELTPWLAENGYTLSPLIRQSRSVITLGGTEYRTEVKKHSIEATTVELRDNTLRSIKAALTSPATVVFTDDEGNDLTRTMYVSGPAATARTVRGGNTYFAGVTITLEER